MGVVCAFFAGCGFTLLVITWRGPKEIEQSNESEKTF